MAPSRDIVVVGAGVVGCAVAYELARRGASVEIVDERGVGMGATQASAGMLAPYHEAPDGGPLLEIAARALDVYDDFLSRLAAPGGLPLNYHRSGSLEIACTDAAVTRLRRTHAALAARGITVRWLDAGAVRTTAPALSEHARAGLLVPSHGFVSAQELTRALVAGARRHGARLIEQGRVTRVESSGPEIAVVTERGTITADAVVLAAGSWSGQIAIGGGGLMLPVTPVRGQLLQLRWAEPPLAQVVWGEHCYLVPWADGTVLVGATVEEVGFDERTTVDGVQTLMSAVRDLIPSTSTAAFIGARAGLRPAAPDHLPIVGRSSAVPNLAYATAHFRNGILLAPLTALLLADLILEGRSDPMLDLMSPSRFGAF